MKIILLSLLAMMLAGCDNQTRVIQTVDKDGNVINTHIRRENASCRLNPNCIVIVERCEYFVVHAYCTYTYVHKGNCKNPIHWENKKGE